MTNWFILSGKRLLKYDFRFMQDNDAGTRNSYFYELQKERHNVLKIISVSTIP